MLTLTERWASVRRTPRKFSVLTFHGLMFRRNRFFIYRKGYSLLYDLNEVLFFSLICDRRYFIGVLSILLTIFLNNFFQESYLYIGRNLASQNEEIPERQIRVTFFVLNTLVIFLIYSLGLVTSWILLILFFSKLAVVLIQNHVFMRTFIYQTRMRVMVKFSTQAIPQIVMAILCWILFFTLKDLSSLFIIGILCFTLGKILSELRFLSAFTKQINPYSLWKNGIKPRRKISFPKMVRVFFVSLIPLFEVSSCAFFLRDWNKSALMVLVTIELARWMTRPYKALQLDSQRAQFHSNFILNFHLSKISLTYSWLIFCVILAILLALGLLDPIRNNVHLLYLATFLNLAIFFFGQMRFRSFKLFVVKSILCIVGSVLGLYFDFFHSFGPDVLIVLNFVATSHFIFQWKRTFPTQEQGVEKYSVPMHSSLQRFHFDLVKKKLSEAGVELVKWIIPGKLVVYGDHGQALCQKLWDSMPLFLAPTANYQKVGGRCLRSHEEIQDYYQVLRKKFPGKHIFLCSSYHILHFNQRLSLEELVQLGPLLKRVVSPRLILGKASMRKKTIMWHAWSIGKGNFACIRSENFTVEEISYLDEEKLSFL